MFDLAIIIAMIIGGALFAGFFLSLDIKGFKGVALTVLGAVLGAVTIYLIFLFISLIIWLFITTRCFV